MPIIKPWLYQLAEREANEKRLAWARFHQFWSRACRGARSAIVEMMVRANDWEMEILHEKHRVLTRMIEHADEQKHYFRFDPSKPHALSPYIAPVHFVRATFAPHGRDHTLWTEDPDAVTCIVCQLAIKLYSSARIVIVCSPLDGKQMDYRDVLSMDRIPHTDCQIRDETFPPARFAIEYGITRHGFGSYAYCERCGFIGGLCLDDPSTD